MNIIVHKKNITGDYIPDVYTIHQKGDKFEIRYMKHGVLRLREYDIEDILYIRHVLPHTPNEERKLETLYKNPILGGRDLNHNN